jgi:hypothetical protein
MKIVINACYGGFSVSIAAAEFMAERGCPVAKSELAEYRTKLGDKRKRSTIERKYGVSWYGYGYTDDDHEGYSRASPHLVAAVEALGTEAASGSCARLKVVEIPDNIEWSIGEYDGFEHVAESHRTWS